MVRKQQTDSCLKITSAGQGLNLPLKYQASSYATWIRLGKIAPAIFRKFFFREENRGIDRDFCLRILFVIFYLALIILSPCLTIVKQKELSYNWEKEKKGLFGI